MFEQVSLGLLYTKLPPSMRLWSLHFLKRNESSQTGFEAHNFYLGTFAIKVTQLNHMHVLYEQTSSQKARTVSFVLCVCAFNGGILTWLRWRSPLFWRYSNLNSSPWDSITLVPGRGHLKERMTESPPTQTAQKEVCKSISPALAWTLKQDSTWICFLTSSPFFS